MSRRRVGRLESLELPELLEKLEMLDR